MRTLDRTRILTRCEIVRVIADLKRRRRSVNTRQNLIVFRLSACCGLRMSEISGLRLCDVGIAGPQPQILLPESSAKRWRPRTVPLWWDKDTLADIDAWKRERIGAGRKHLIRSSAVSTKTRAAKSYRRGISSIVGP